MVQRVMWLSLMCDVWYTQPLEHDNLYGFAGYHFTHQLCTSPIMPTIYKTYNHDNNTISSYIEIWKTPVTSPQQALS